ncbi:hypothetical protein MMC11_008408 [Xylographa trunciseda]|nr:hypothetical protein [Xylographa trunciseda]
MSGIAFSNPARQPVRAATRQKNIVRLCELHFEGIELGPRNSWVKRQLTKWWRSTYPTGNETSAFDRGLLYSAGYPPRADVPEYLVARYPGLIADPGVSNQQPTIDTVVPHQDVRGLKQETSTSMQTLDTLIATIKAAPAVKVEPNSEDEITGDVRRLEMRSNEGDERDRPRKGPSGHEEAQAPKLGSNRRDERYSPRESTGVYGHSRGPEIGRRGREEHHSPGWRTAEYSELPRPRSERNAYDGHRRPAHGTAEHSNSHHESGSGTSYDRHPGSRPDYSRSRNPTYHAENAVEASSTPSGFADLQSALNSLTRAAAVFAPARPDLTALISATSIQVVSIIQSASSNASVEEQARRTGTGGRSPERGSGSKRKRDGWEDERRACLLYGQRGLLTTNSRSPKQKGFISRPKLALNGTLVQVGGRREGFAEKLAHHVSGF